MFKTLLPIMFLILVSMCNGSLNNRLGNDVKHHVQNNIQGHHTIRRVNTIRKENNIKRLLDPVPTGSNLLQYVKWIMTNDVSNINYCYGYGQGYYS